MDAENISGKRVQVPVWQKANLTVKEASEYFNIGEKKIVELSNAKNCPFVLFCGNKRLIKKARFQEYLDKQYSV